MNDDFVSIETYEAEILDGLTLHRERLARAAQNHAYFERRNAEFIPQRPGESWTDYASRPKRCVSLVNAAIQALTANLYNPGPNRQWPNPSQDEWLQEVYKANGINELWQAIDAYAHLNGVACIGVHCTGQADEPVRLFGYGSDEFVAWTKPDEPDCPQAVCTIGRVGEQGRRFCLWTDEEFREYAASDSFSRPKLTWQYPNPYRMLPFVFAHHSKVVRDFWTTGVGDYLRNVNAEIDRELSDIAQLGQFAVPIGIFKNVKAGQRLTIAPGIFNHLSSAAGSAIPSAEYLAASYDSVQRQQAVENYAYLALEMVGVPSSAVRLNAASAMSAIAVITEQLPLLKAAQKRQTPFAEYENRLAVRALQCASVFYGRTDLWPDATHKLALHWLERPLPLPFPERDSGDDWLMDQGLLSQIMLTMGRLGLTREQAIEHLKQVQADEEEIAPKASKIPPLLLPYTGVNSGTGPEPDSANADPGDNDSDADADPSDTGSTDEDA